MFRFGLVALQKVLMFIHFPSGPSYAKVNPQNVGPNILFISKGIKDKFSRLFYGFQLP